MGVRHTLDSGEDTRTGVAMIAYCYDVPFKVSGEFGEMTFKLKPEQKTALNRQGAQSSGTGTMKQVFILVALGEAATGLALLVLLSDGSPNHRLLNSPTSAGGK